jgi:hypothetical protein
VQSKAWNKILKFGYTNALQYLIATDKNKDKEFWKVILLCVIFIVQNHSENDFIAAVFEGEDSNIQMPLVKDFDKVWFRSK